MDVLQAHTVSSRIITHGPDACIDSAAASGYLNQPEVWAALHVQDPGFCWSVCGSTKGWSYESTRTNLPANTYPELVGDMRVVIFNGDWDACVPYTDGQAWTEGMGFKAEKPWHAWTYTSTMGNENQVAGYATKYDVAGQGSGEGSFEFITIRGGRHEAPETAPGQVMEMLNRLLGGREF
jgi:serine carboxypeptidase-like clade 1